ncbi:MAG: glycosyltransferase family 4 protein [Candidatus Altiarchaeota archaeon]|nr:glycosyltransferase family 4 protein [Candidatus Altiarchaeota archaeon]
MKVVLLSPYSLGASSCKRLYYLTRNLKFARKLLLLKEDKYGKTAHEDWFSYTSKNRDDRKYPLQVLNTFRLLVKERPDIIHYSKPHHLTLIPALMYKKTFGCKLVFDCDDWELIVQKELGAGRQKLLIVERLMRLGFRTADAIVVPNTRMLREIPEKYRKKAFLIPNGVDTKKFKPLKTKKTKGRYNVTYMGTIHKIDTITPLVEAIIIAGKKIPGLICTVVGGGKAEKELKRRIRKQKADRYFKLLGMQPHEKIPKLLSNADVLVLPYSKLESLEYASNLKFFEYMALQKPIVAGAVGDIPLILDKGKAGYLFPPGDAKAMAEKIEEAYGHPEEAEAKAKNAREIAMKEYDWNVLGKKLQKVYEKL